MDVGIRATQEQLPRGLGWRIKSTIYIPLIPAFSLEGEGADTCVDTYDPDTGQPHCLGNHKGLPLHIILISQQGFLLVFIV
jgi:hypothetical protein